MFGSENLEDNFDALLHLVEEFIIAAWEMRKQKLCGDDFYPGQLQRQPSARNRGPVVGRVGSRVSLVSHMVRVRAVVYMLS